MKLSPLKNTALTTQQLEALLFFVGKPLSFKEVADIFEISKEECIHLVTALRGELEDRGIILLVHESECALATHPHVEELIHDYQQNEINVPLSKPALETLAIILYQGEISKVDIDYIRGVNSQFILRQLVMRSLIEKKENKNDKRSVLYVPTLDTLAHLGIPTLDALPERESIQQKLEVIRHTYENGSF